MVVHIVLKLNPSAEEKRITKFIFGHKKLKGFSYAYRLRVGDWCMLFDMKEEITKQTTKW
jgi:mRNA-degrading endonuclease RelE of RelBE toxin-antitoxin system